MTTPTRPVLRYHGGKWRLTPWILSFFPAHRVYVEPFGGGASVLIPGYDCELYTELYSDWERHSTSALADGARKRTEVVWLNAACRAALDAGRSQYEMVGTAEAGA
jgi:hypothetical protein